MTRNRQLVYGSLVIDLRDDVKMTAVISLMDSLIMCYKYCFVPDEFYYYGSDGTIVKGQANIRGYADKMRDIEKLPF